MLLRSKFCLLLLILGNIQNLSAQGVKKDSLSKYIDTLDAVTFTKLLNNQFTSIITGQSKNTIGNFGGVDIKDASVALNISKITNKGNVFSLNANAAVSDGFSSIFTNSKLNSDVGVQFRFSFLNPYSKTIRYVESSIKKRDFEIHKKNALAEIEKRLVVKRLHVIESLIKLDSIEIAQLLTADQNSFTIQSQLAAKNYRLDSLRFVKAKELSDISAVIKTIEAEKKSFIRKAKLEIPEITGFTLSWFNIVYKVNSQSFRRFDPSLVFAEQVKKGEYVSHKAGIEYNFYNWSIHNAESRFFSIGAVINVSNNLSSLGKTELSETSNYGAVSGQRASTKKYNVYTGKYESGLIGGTLYSDYYQFVFDNNSAAIHLYPQAKFQKSERPNYSFGLGFLMAFKDQKDEKGKSIINAELYVNFLDLANTAGTERKLLERNDIGLRFSFPIKFIYKD